MDATCSLTTDLDAGASRSKLLALTEDMGTASGCEWGGGEETNTTGLWWTLFSGSTSTGGRLSACRFVTLDRQPTALSRSCAGKAFHTFIAFLRSFREAGAEK
ncbi:hypothetical protein EBZ80_11850 [bacterium]|nr:hypothetical protein [bacterium]